MPGWHDILSEISADPLAMTRKKYLDRLVEYTNRNVICYYSAFLTKVGHPSLSINDMDMTGFMNAIKDLQPNTGLDLFLHTPGGTPTSARQ